MRKQRPSISTVFFLLFSELLVCSLVVSSMVWACIKMNLWLADPCKIDPWRPSNVLFLSIFTFLITAIFLGICIYSYSWVSSNGIIYSSSRIDFTLFIYWLSSALFYIPIVNVFVGQFQGKNNIAATLLFFIPDKWWQSNGEILPWAMVLLSVLLLIFYTFTEHYLLKLSGHWTPIRIILYRRFVIIGNILPRLKSGWPLLAVKFFNVLFLTWLLQSFSRILWKATESHSFFNLNYVERLSSPIDPSNGTLFNSFSATNNSLPLAVNFSGQHFCLDILSSIFSLLWHHALELVAIWFVLEVLGCIWASSSRLVIVNASGEGGAQDKKNDKDESKKAEPVGPDLADLLATKLDRIKQVYQSVDEKRPISSACGAGEPIDAAIKVERLEDISLSSASEIKLGPFGIPTSSISALISHILRGPKISVGLCRHKQETLGSEAEKEESQWTEKVKAKQALMASLSGSMGSQRWVVECREPLEEDSRGKERSIDDMVTELAHRIHASYAEILSKEPGESVSWKALWNFDEGMRAYRDCLKLKKKHKYFLNRAEKKFIDALEEENSFSLAHYNLGVVYAELGRRDSAKECFKKAIDVNPELWEAYYALGIAIFREAKDMEQSFDIFGIPMQPEVELLIIADYKKVIELSQRVLEIKIREETIFEKDFSAKARAYNLMGNAQARLAWRCQVDGSDAWHWNLSAKNDCCYREISENDKESLKQFLNKNLGICGIKTENIFQYDDETIKIPIKDDDIDYDLSLKFKDNKTKAVLKLDDLRTCNFKVKTENSALILFQEPNVGLLENARELLEKAVNYSWMALIKESVLHETAEDESSIVSECTVDLAHVYLKLSECYGNKCKADNMVSKAWYILLEAIYIKSQDINLYCPLSMAAQLKKWKNFEQQIYEQARRVKPESSRIRAHILASTEPGKDKKPASWLKEFERSECCHEDMYERVYHFLANAIEAENYIFSMKMCFEREKLVSDLSKLSGLERSVFPSLREKRCLLSEDSRLSLAIWRSVRYLAANGESNATLEDLLNNPLDPLKAFIKEHKLCETEDAKKQTKPLFIWNRFSEFDKKALSAFLAKNLDLEGIEAPKIELENGTKIKIPTGSGDINLRLNGRTELILEIGNLKCNDFIVKKFNNDIYVFVIMLDRAESLFSLSLIFLELAKIRADEYLNERNNIVNITPILEKLCENYRCIEYMSLKEQSDIFLRCSQKHVNCIMSIMDGIPDKRRSDRFYKKEISYYYVEAGKAFLDIGDVSCSLDIDGSKCNKRAKDLFDEALKIIGDDPQEVKRYKIRMHLARAYLGCGKLPSALKEAQIAKDLSPLDFEERKVLGKIFCELQEYKFGLAELNTALAYNPDDPKILFDLGKAYFFAGKDCRRKGEERNWLLKKARQKLEEALEIIDKSEVRHRGKIRYWIGRTMLEMGNYEEAIPHFRILAKKDEGDYLPALYLGYAYLKCNSHEECESSLHKLIQSLKPKAVFLELWDKIWDKIQDDYKKKNVEIKNIQRNREVCDSISIEFPPSDGMNSSSLDKIKTYAFSRSENNKFADKVDGRMLTITKKPDHSPGERVTIDRFCGRQYEDARHLDEILARAYIYLAYSYAERDANSCDSWGLASSSQKYIDLLRENGGVENETARDGVLERSDRLCSESGFGFISFSALNGSSQSDSSIVKKDEGYSLDGNKIEIKFDAKDGIKKRKCKAHLAECAGTICYKMGNISAAVDFLNASIALYPDAGAYINLAKAYERSILGGMSENFDKGLIDRTIIDLCRHAELLDLKDEHKKDLKYFREQYLSQKKGSSERTGDGSPSGEKKP